MTGASTNKFNELCEALESERNDISYRNHFSRPQVQVVTKTLKVIPERLKQIYFHAGRYSSGDRDRLANQAWSEYELAEEL